VNQPLDRSKKLLSAMHVGEGEAVLLHKPSNMFYVSGYTGEGLVLLTAHGKAIVTDFRYTEQAEKQSPGYRVFMTTRDCDHNQTTYKLLKEQGIRKIFFEDDHVTVRDFRELEKAMGGMSFQPVEKVPEKLREIKDDTEIEKMARACKITSEAFTFILSEIKEGMTEIEIARTLEHYMLTHGAQELAFHTIVASGENGSLPHAVPGERTVRKGDMITMDFGAKVDGYCADMTRTVALGEPGETMRHVYHVVFTAQQMAQDALMAGRVCRDIDAIARDYIYSNGFSENFGHGLGHSLGIDIHESPRLSMLCGDTTQEKQVLTVEPGVYLPGIGGVRIENSCVVLKDGCCPLTTAPKELIIL
jgi:Xaa-Pro aminopeptidase